MADLADFQKRFSESGNRVLNRAVEESRRRDHNFIGPEHIFSALAEIERPLFNEVMQSLNIDPQTVLQAVDAQLGVAKQFVGTRLKVLEAMASGKAIVSTPVGAEGLPVKNGENIVLAESPQEFAKAVVSLIRNRATRRQFEMNARAVAESGLSWRAAAERLEEAVLATLTDSAKVQRGTAGPSE